MNQINACPRVLKPAHCFFNVSIRLGSISGFGLNLLEDSRIGSFQLRLVCTRKSLKAPARVDLGVMTMNCSPTRYGSWKAVGGSGSLPSKHGYKACLHLRHPPISQNE